MACGEPEKFLLAQQLCAALGFIGLLNLNRVTLSAFGLPLETDDDERAGSVRSTIRNLRGRRRASEMGAWLVSGSLEVRPENRPIRFVDYGSGNCDGQITVVIDGETYVLNI